MSEEDSLWEDKEKAQSIFKEKRKLENLLNNFNKLESEYEDLVNFNELFKSENDDGLKQELTDLLTNTVKLSTVLKINTLLSEVCNFSIIFFILIIDGLFPISSKEWNNLFSIISFSFFNDADSKALFT